MHCDVVIDELVRDGSLQYAHRSPLGLSRASLSVLFTLLMLFPAVSVVSQEGHVRPPVAPGQAFLPQRDTCENLSL